MRILARAQRGRGWGIGSVLALFVLAGMVVFWSADGEDLASSYVGCRLVATHQTGLLYEHASDNFADVGDLTGTWVRLGSEGAFHGYLHPYVQTPLWAWSLQPICGHMNFWNFERLFLLLTMLALAATVFLIARYWTPSLYGPIGLGVVLLFLWFSQPFQYAMFLMQTHALFFFLTVAGLILAERDRPWLAGLCMACGAAVKVTPGVVLIYWLLTRRWKAAGALVVWSVVLMVATVAAVGPHLTGAYLTDLQRVSHVLLVAQNNQSLAAWWMAHAYPADAVFDIDILPLPTRVRLLSLGCMLGFTVLGGLIDARRRTRFTDAALLSSNPAPIGAMMTLLALTLFAPIAWTHYSIILVAPLMVLWQEMRALRQWWIGIAVGLIAVLNYPPLATDIIHMDVADYSVIRGQFFAGMLCLVTLGGVAAWRRWPLSAKDLPSNTGGVTMVESV